MEKICFNCGQPGHFYFQCTTLDSVDGSYRKISKKAFEELHPEVNESRFSKKLERDQWKKEALSVPLPLIEKGIDFCVDFFFEILENMKSTPLQIHVFKQISNLDAYSKWKKEVDLKLPEVRLLTTYAVPHLVNNPDLNYLTRQILWGRQQQLRDIRDEVVDRINSSLSCVRKLCIYMKEKNQSPTGLNQVDLRFFAVQMQKINNMVEIFDVTGEKL